MEVTKSYCNQCVGERKHMILHAEINSGSTHEDGYNWSTTHETLKCLGCDTISLRRTCWDTIETDEHGSPVMHVVHFPPAALRRQPEWVSELQMHFIFDSDKDFLSDLINEIYVCVQNDCRRSAVMAIRALLEQVMIDKIGDKGSFVKNIAEYQSKGFISNTQRVFLETVIEAGHATMHRAYKPSKKDVVALINITENVIESAYVNEHRASEIKKRIPPKNTVIGQRSP